MPLFQNESECETIHMKMSFASRFIFMQIKLILKRMVLQTRFETEAQGNSEMAYSVCRHCSSCNCFGAKEHCFCCLFYCLLKGLQAIHVRHHVSCNMNQPSSL